MNRTIYKYKLETTDRQTITMRKDAEILCVQEQHGQPCIWALVNDDIEDDYEERKFDVFGTGHPIDEAPRKYIGTYQLKGGVFVFHVFEREPR